MKDHMNNDRAINYQKNSMSLIGAVSMGTGVMIGAGILALTGQIAQLAGSLFPLVFLASAVVTAFSAYSYVKLSNAYPSAGGIGMFLEKAYGRGMITAVGALLMYFSMVINESLVARTFGTYAVQIFNINPNSWIVTILSVLVLIFAFLLNISGNKMIGMFSLVMASIKIGGILLFAAAGLWVSGISLEKAIASPIDSSFSGFVAAMALAILAYKGFTTITNSGSEIINPHRNVGRAIIISIVVCVVVYFLVAIAVLGNLSIPEIIASKDYVLAQAAKPVFGNYGLWFTVGIAIVATVSGIIASVFAVSRMLAMLTEMKLVPHSHFGMPGDIQKHTLVYTVVIAIFLTIFFDLSRIASLGAIFYIIMDIVIHWGIFRHLRKKINANATILLTAIIFDIIILGVFVFIKAQQDITVIYAAVIGILFIMIVEKIFLKNFRSKAV